MLEKFQKFIDQKQLFKATDKLLLAVSGGVDSMVLVELIRQANYPFGIAHCNFTLRGEESDKDADLVREKAAALNIPYFEKSFDTIAAAKENSQSIQMMARSLRYNWFEELMKKEGFDYLLTAHHFDDSIETFLLNFLRGTGLKGLTGIPLKNNQIVRPLLFANQQEIINFATQNGVAFREDSSNTSDKYQRNYLRHHVLPHLYELQPQLKNIGQHSFSILEQSQQLNAAAIKKWQEKLCRETANQELEIDKKALQQLAFGQLLLWEFLSPKDFTAEQVRQALTAKTGTLIKSRAWQLYVGKDDLVLGKIKIKTIQNTSIDTLDFKIQLTDNQIFLGKKINKTVSSFQTAESIALINLSKIILPLTIRKWRAGDIFCPLGMDGKKQKVQDFFANNKLNAFQKSATWILENGDGKIIWIIGHRLDDRFKLIKPVSEYWRLAIVDKNANL